MHPKNYFDLTGMKQATIHRRIKAGWSIERALTQDVAKVKLISYNGKSMNLAEWARETGISRDTLFERMSAGWSVEEMLSVPPKIGNNQYISTRVP